MPVLSIFFGIIVRMWHDDYLIKILRAVHLVGRRIELTFSDGLVGEWDATALLARTGPLLEPLQDQAFFERFFIDAGAFTTRSRRPNTHKRPPQRSDLHRRPLPDGLQNRIVGMHCSQS
jgi:hypothetical protein